MTDLADILFGTQVVARRISAGEAAIAIADIVEAPVEGVRVVKQVGRVAVAEYRVLRQTDPHILIIPGADEQIVEWLRLFHNSRMAHSRDEVGSDWYKRVRIQGEKLVRNLQSYLAPDELQFVANFVNLCAASGNYVPRPQSFHVPVKEMRFVERYINGNRLPGDKEYNETLAFIGDAMSMMEGEA